MKQDWIGTNIKISGKGINWVNEYYKKTANRFYF
jgi:hypothetical protein